MDGAAVLPRLLLIMPRLRAFASDNGGNAGRYSRYVFNEVMVGEREARRKRFGKGFMDEDGASGFFNIVSDCNWATLGSAHRISSNTCKTNWMPSRRDIIMRWTGVVCVSL